MTATADALMAIFGFKRVEGKQMKTDRELLEMAARAAGIEIVPCTCGYEQWPFKYAEGQGEYGHWNPLAADGDALRLAVELGLNFTTGDLACAASWPPHKAWVNEVVEAHQGDRASATRRAIVRAAAAIGESQQ